MRAGEPDRDGEAETRSSLAGWLSGWLRNVHPAHELAAAIAVLIALGPLATIAGAQLLARQERSEAERLRADLAPRLAAEQSIEAARAEIGAILQRPAIGATLEAFARGLPADATVVRIERNAGGTLEADITATDPDQLRASIRRDPALAGLRNTSQRQSDTAMIVTLRQDAP